MEDKDWSRVDVQREVVAVLQKVVRDARLAFEQAAVSCLEVTAGNKRENREVRRLRQARDKAERTYIGLSRTLERETAHLSKLEEEHSHVQPNSRL
jgi:hypothetical protein